jgi:hypothetical protein
LGWGREERTAMKSLVAVGIIAAFAATPVFAQDCGCAADVNGDRIVDIGDLLQVLGDWGCMDCPLSDLDGSGEVGVSDLLTVLGDWGCGTAVVLTSFEGIVTNSLTGDPVVGAVVAVGDCDPMTTDGTGAYAGDFPVGPQTVTIEALHYVTQEQSVVLFPGFDNELYVVLEPVAPVVVTVVFEEASEPGDTVFATAMVDVLDGSSVTGFDWSQLVGAEAFIENADQETAIINLASAGVYKEYLLQVISEPPISEDDLPPGIHLPEEFPAGLQNRFHVVPVNPFALEEAGAIGLAVDVTTTSGLYTGEGDVHTNLPWKKSLGIRNVPIGETVLLYGKEQASYDWQLSPPAASDAELVDAMTRSPEFTPDVHGLYAITVTDIGAAAPVDIFVFAGNYGGVIVGQDAEGTPLVEDTCLNCHIEGGVAPDKFTPWAQTGHSRIFTDMLNTNDHWGPQCFTCHSVGYDPEGIASGIAQAADFQAFLVSGLLHNPSPDNWTDMLDMFPASAKLANIQCENCHGPQDGAPGAFSPAHTTVFSRVSLAADACAVCHGEPLRHARFQQWQLSGHANYELAIDESESGSCSRCHTVNGFLAWLPVLLGDVPGDPTGDVTVTWTADEAHPQTCVACHDPHSIGTTSGSDNDATVRISGNTPHLIAGFTAYGVGRGAICMTCHNSRRGLRNDDTWPDFVGTSEAARAPHGSAQTDMIMGQNAYLVEVGNRGNHSFITDTCANCHMEATPPPAALSYNQSGTNHTFAARRDICTECHGGGFTADGIQGSIQENLDILQGLIENGIVDVMDEQIALGNVIDVGGDVLVTDVDDIDAILLGESRGRQAITITVLGVEYGPVGLNSVLVLDDAMVELGQLYDFAPDALPQSGWNWALVNNDGSLGIHNPSYAFDVIVAGIQGLDPGARIAVPFWLTTPAPTVGKAGR